MAKAIAEAMKPSAIDVTAEDVEKLDTLFSQIMTELFLAPHLFFQRGMASKKGN